MSTYVLITFKDFSNTVKPVLRDHSKIDKTKILKTNNSLMKVKCIAEQVFFLPVLTTNIRSCSQCQKVCFFPNLNKKIPNSRNKKKNGRKNNKISPFYDVYVCG